jgi:type II secretory pathway pseudopilin PulG
MKRGATLLEVIITLAILAGAGLGTLASLGATSKSLRAGQLTQHKMLLLDARAQRRLLENKGNLLTAAVIGPYPVATKASPSYPPNLPLGGGNWVPDTVPAGLFDRLDLSTGAYFAVSPNGQIVKLDQVPWTDPFTGITYPGIPAGTACGSALLNVPGIPTVYCRETMLTRGPPVAPTAGTLTNRVGTLAQVTYWIRVSRVGEQPQDALFRREVIAP